MAKLIKNIAVTHDKYKINQQKDFSLSYFNFFIYIVQGAATIHQF
jgi:hypothetical protein